MFRTKETTFDEKHIERRFFAFCFKSYAGSEGWCEFRCGIYTMIYRFFVIVFRSDDITFDSGGNVFCGFFNLQSVYFAKNIKNAWRFNAFLMVFL